MLAGALSLQRGPITAVSWNATGHGTPVGRWCVGYQSADGVARYAHSRGQVIRYSKEGAEASAAEMRRILERAAARKDPFCVLERGAGYVFGTYSSLLPASEGGNGVHRVETVDVQPLTRAILETHNFADNWYAPLILLRDPDEGSIITFNGAVILLSDPLQLPAKLENWRYAGIDLPSVATTILETDDAVDRLFAEAFNDGFGVVLDPLLAGDGELIAGYTVYDQRMLIDQPAQPE